MIYAFLTFPFLLVLFPFLFLLLSYLVESDEYGFSIFIVAFMAVLFQLFSNVRPADFIMNNFVESICIVIGWYFIGTIYAICKWYIYVYKAARQVREWREKNTYLPEYKLSDIANSLGYRELPPQVSSNKGKIVGWISFWIFSLFGTLLNDVIREFVNWIYNQIGGVLQKISDKAFSGL